MLNCAQCFMKRKQYNELHLDQETEAYAGMFRRDGWTRLYD